MQRVNLGKPYEDYIKKLVKEGYYASASEVLRDALRDKMRRPQIKEPQKTLSELVQGGIDDVEAGRLINYDSQFWKKINKSVKERIKNNSHISPHVRP